MENCPEFRRATTSERILPTRSGFSSMFAGQSLLSTDSLGEPASRDARVDGAFRIRN